MSVQVFFSDIIFLFTIPKRLKCEEKEVDKDRKTDGLKL